MSFVFQTVNFPGVVLEGIGSPTVSVGQDGQLYVQKDANNNIVALWGPKVNGNWGIPTSVIGSPISLVLNPNVQTGDPNDTTITQLDPLTYRLNLVLPPGSVGPPGSSVVLSTTGQPPNSVGMDGQMAWDSVAKVMWGPKVGGNWAGTDVSLAPAQFLNGSGPPTNQIGKINDYYINVDNGDLYGPKSSGGWGVAIYNLGSGGGGGGAYLISDEYIAAQDISSIKVFACLNPGEAILANANNIHHLGKVVGVTVNACLTNELVRGVTQGLILDSNISLPVGDLYLGSNGNLISWSSINLNTIKFIQKIGYTTNNGELYVSIEEPLKVVN